MIHPTLFERQAPEVRTRHTIEFLGREFTVCSSSFSVILLLYAFFSFKARSPLEKLHFDTKFTPKAKIRETCAGPQFCLLHFVWSRIFPMLPLCI